MKKLTILISISLIINSLFTSLGINIEQEIPEIIIRKPKRVSNTAENLNNKLPRKGVTTYYNIEENLKKYEGKWVWRSENNDTVFILEFIDATVCNPVILQNPDTGMPVNDKKIFNCHNRLIGKYKYIIKDSVIYSNLESKFKFKHRFFPLKTSNKKELLIGFSTQPAPKEFIHLILHKNPLGKQRGFITFTLLNDNFAAWNLNALLKDDKEYVKIRKAIEGDFIFPTYIIMEKVKE